VWNQLERDDRGRSTELQLLLMCLVASIFSFDKVSHSI
jgi:hypothetical protein